MKAGVLLSWALAWRWDQLGWTHLCSLHLKDWVGHQCAPTDLSANWLVPHPAGLMVIRQLESLAWKSAQDTQTSSRTITTGAAGILCHSGVTPCSAPNTWGGAVRSAAASSPWLFSHFSSKTYNPHLRTSNVLPGILFRKCWAPNIYQVLYLKLRKVSEWMRYVVLRTSPVVQRG